MVYESNSSQRKFWQGDFGNSYADRCNTVEKINEEYNNQTGVNFDYIYNKFFEGIDKDSKIIEIACNIGLKLSILKKLGFRNLYGLEINKKAYETAKKINPDISFIHSSIEEYDPKGEQFDVVCTGGILVHMHPSVLDSVIKKMVSLSRQYVFGFEYYADELTEVTYRGHSNQLWKQNFPLLFKKLYPTMKIIKEEKIVYKDKKLVDIAYLLKK